MKKLTDMVRALAADGIGDKWLSRLDEFSPDWKKWNQRLFALLLLALAAHFCIYAYSVVKVFPFPYRFKGYTSDEMMYSALLLSRGQNFYRDPVKGYGFTGPYPPGFQFLTAPLVGIFGPGMWVGRLVAVSGLVLIWVLMFRTVRKITGKKLYGLIAVGLLMAAYGAMDAHFDDIHPDSWCAAMGLLSLAWAESSLHKPAWIVPAALAAFFSFLFKQSGLTFAAGAALFLSIHRPRYAAYYLLIVAVLTAASLAVGQALTGGTYWLYQVTIPDNIPIIWARIPICLYFQIFTFSFIIIFLVFMLMNKPTSLPLSSPYALALPLVYLGFGTAAVHYGGAVWSNFFPAAVLIAIMLACGLHYVRSTLSLASPRIATLLLTLILAQNLKLLAHPPPIVTKEHYQTARQVEQIIRSTPGEVLVFHNIAFAYLNGRKVYDNWLILGELGWRNQARLESQLRSRYFERIISPRKAIEWGMHGTLLDALLQNYDVEKVINKPEWFQTTPLVILKRKGAAEPPGGPAPGAAGPGPAGQTPRQE